jgi:Tfp pilus assembly protein PilV
MKKILLALLILGAGAIAFARLNLLANQSRTSATRSRAECAGLASQVNELAATATDLRAQAEAKKTPLVEASLPSASASAAGGARSGDSSKTSRRPTLAELRQRFGIGWNNSADYVLVSKAALQKMYLRGIERNGTFTPTACAILGLTPDERAAVQAALKRAEVEHETWLKTAVQRVEPADDVLADYRLPTNAKLAHQIEEEGTALLTETLGPERAKLVHDYAGPWLFTHGELGAKSIRLTVRRHLDGTQPPLWWQLQEQDGNSCSSDVRSKDFPELFRSVFPGGWRDLAQREGFTLPEDFQ